MAGMPPKYITTDEAVTIVKLQVGLLGTARQLKRDLNKITGRADTTSPDGLHYILQGTYSAWVTDH